MRAYFKAVPVVEVDARAHYVPDELIVRSRCWFFDTDDSIDALGAWRRAQAFIRTRRDAFTWRVSASCRPSFDGPWTDCPIVGDLAEAS